MNAKQKSRAFYAGAILLLALGAIGIWAGAHSFSVRAVGLLAILASVRLVRLSRAQRQSIPGYVMVPRTDSETNSGLDRVMKVIGVALIPVAAASAFYLYLDAVHGYQDSLALYLFVAVGLACTVVWSYLAARHV